MTQPSSPFAKKVSPAATINVTPSVVAPVAVAPKPSGFLQPSAAPIRQATAISKADIEQLGTDLQVNVNRTTNKIIDSMTAAKFGDIGTILVQVQNTAEKLDPNKQFGGISGWFRSKFVDIKSYLRQEFQTAGKVFDQLVIDLTKHIATHDTWVKNLDLIFDENHANYRTLVELISKAESWKAALQQQIAGLPPIAADDPDAIMKAQDKADLEALVNRLDIKIDTFRRLKMLCENNAPKIRGQQKTSETNKAVLRDIIDFTIPTIRQEFALYLNSLDSQKTQQLIQNTRTFAQQTMVKSADAAATAAVTAAKNLNAPMIDNPTLDHLRDRIMSTIVEVKRIEGEAATQRQADASTMQQSTQQFIAQLQANI